MGKLPVHVLLVLTTLVLAALPEHSISDPIRLPAVGGGRTMRTSPAFFLLVFPLTRLKWSRLQEEHMTSCWSSANDIRRVPNRQPPRLRGQA